MTITDYYEKLDLPVNSSLEEIKKAYRVKARLYHPDINPESDAKDLFISVTEAYEFLIANHNSILAEEQAFNQALEDWRKYRQDMSRRKATAYARSSYSEFKKTKLYKTTRIFDGTTIILSFFVSIIVIAYTIFGYAFRLKHPIPGLKNPSVFAFLMLLLLGLIFFGVSCIYLRIYLTTSKKNKKKNI